MEQEEWDLEIERENNGEFYEYKYFNFKCR